MATRVLVVDDAVFMRTVLKRMLVEEGMEIVGEAGNGQEAIQKAKDLQPEVITLDITMPVMDGLEALTRILEVSPASKVIMCSAMGQQAMVVDAIKAGAKDFVVKPFQKPRVIEAIENALKE